MLSYTGQNDLGVRKIMIITKEQKNNITVAVVESEEILINDIQSALDFIVNIGYETACDRIALNKSAITEEFFKLSTCLAGGILQKFINYHVKFAIIGDFSGYASKPLKDFIYESNNGKDIFFVATKEDAIERLSCV
jgi:hypothetical protein